LSIAIILYALNEWLHFETPADHFMDKYSFWGKVAFGLILAPFFETFLHQWLIYKLLRRFNLNNLLLVFFSAVLFGLAHCYSLSYIIFAFFTGIFLMLAFIYWEGEGISKYMITVLIHMIHNGFMLLLSLLLP